MRLISSCISLLVLTGIVQCTFPNDLYYHHHPEQLAKANNKNQQYKNYATPHRYDRGGYRSHYDRPSRHHYGGRGNYHHSNGRANYHEGTRHRLEPRGNTEEPSMYNKDGSINWSYKAAGQSDNYSNRRQYRRPYEDDYPRGRYGEPRNLYEDDYYQYDDSYYDDDYQENSYYDNYDAQGYGDQQYGRGQQSGNGQQSNSGQQYGNDQQYDNGQQYDNDQQYDNGDQYGNDQYGNGQRGSRNSGQQGGSNNNQRGNRNYDQQSGSNTDQRGDSSYNEQPSNDQNQDSSQANTRARYGQSGTGFGGGLRLAGALPDDGYNRGLGTFYDLETHVGICGKQHKNSELVASVNQEQMGDGCGKEIEIVGPSGKSIKALVVDSCKTCKTGGLDLSPAAYGELGDFSHGSVPIKWKFI